jgi:hypothetical protein
MTATLTQVVKQFQQDWTGQLEPDAILTACRDVAYRWRERMLDPVTAEMQPATAWLRRRLWKTMPWGCIFRIPELHSFRIVEFLSQGKHL